MAIIDDGLVRKLLYDQVGGRRFTQDTPIMPEVWLAFAEDPTGPLDLILTPTHDTPSGRVAKELRELLREYRREKKGWKPLRGTRKLRTRLSHVPGQITARVYFDELMRIVLAVTPWWKLRPEQVRSAEHSPLFGFPDPEDGDEERMTDAIVESLERYRKREPTPPRAEDDELPADLVWVVRLVGAIALGCEWDGRKAGVPETSRALLSGKGYIECLEEYLEPAAKEASEHEERCAEVSRLLALSFLEVYRDWPIAIPPEGSLLWRVTLNREAEAAIHKSSLTVKADAARLLFEISSKNITWAVVDSGIDRDHPAFRDHHVELGDEMPPRQRLAHGTGTGAFSTAPGSSSNGGSRVIHTFDFTGLRDLLDPDVVEELLRQQEEGYEPEDPELADAAAELWAVLKQRRAGTSGAGTSGTGTGGTGTGGTDTDGTASTGDAEGEFDDPDLLDDIRELRMRIEQGYEIDWGLLERFIEDHDPKPPKNEHGTHVAGILGADWRDSADSERVIMKGIAPDVRLLDVRVLREDGRSDEFEVMAAIQYLRYRNSRAGYMDVHGANLSLAIQHEVANYACGRTPICDECEEATAIGMVIVAAAGNEGYVEYATPGGVALQGYSTVSITDPGNARAVITVGATHRTMPHEYGVSYFSSRGPTGDGRVKPDLVAPGEKIKGPIPGERSAYKDGTSMAAPHVSGAAVLLMARYSELIGHPGRIKQILCDTATDLGRERYFQGYGMLDILRALQSI